MSKVGPAKLFSKTGKIKGWQHRILNDPGMSVSQLAGRKVVDPEQSFPHWKQQIFVHDITCMISWGVRIFAR